MRRDMNRRLWASALALPVALLLALLLGVADLPLGDTAAVLLGGGSDLARQIVLEIRLPRVLTGALAGAQFAASGMILQRVTRNPLADPTLLGISQGAVLAVALFLLLVVWRTADPYALVALPVAWMPAAGAIGGLAAAALIFAAASGRGAGPLRLTLCGIAGGAVLHALSLGLISGWGSARLEIVMRWMSGSLYARGWGDAGFLALSAGPLVPLLALAARPLAIAGFRADTAQGWGLNWRLWYPALIALAAALAATAAGVVGPLLFVGLMAPHLAARIASGPMLLPVSAAVGAVLVTLSDLAGRLAGGADEVPVGVVTAILGAPVMLILLNKGQSR